MIDYDTLNQNYENDDIYALQLEIGDKCNQGCIYCYMNAVEEEKNTLSDEQIKNIILDAKKLNISAIEWLGGEPLLRKSLFSHMSLSQKLGFRNNIWTGGLPLHDDDIHTFDYVIDSLMDVCSHDINQAEQCTFIVHYKGKCEVKKGPFNFLKPMKDGLINRGLNATID